VLFVLIPQARLTNVRTDQDNGAYFVVISVGSRLLKLLRAATRFNAGNRRMFTTTKGKEVGDVWVKNFGVNQKKKISRAPIVREIASITGPPDLLPGPFYTPR
jgi:hypothetical protein